MYRDYLLIFNLKVDEYPDGSTPIQQREIKYRAVYGFLDMVLVNYDKKIVKSCDFFGKREKNIIRVI